MDLFGITLLGLTGLLGSESTPTQTVSDEDLKQRVDKLEAQNQELMQQIGSLTDEVFRLDFGDVVPPIGESRYGLGPAASKVYSKSEGISIGGYGEAIYQATAGQTDEWDILRVIMYFGYKFTDKWVLNTEIEFEHADQTSVEFATLDYLYSEAVNFRAGLVLVPMGFINELHEPNTFLSADRTQTETRIIPTTWRENGAGIFGDVGPMSYRAYIVNGFDGAGFSETGLRGGRQKGSEALAEDLAVVVRADYTETPGVIVGGSVYHGNSGQDQAGLEDTATTIWELHGEAKYNGLWFRGLYAMATVDDVEELNAAGGFTGTDSVGEQLEGGYVEVAYDVMRHLDAESGVNVRPFVRYETVDTQAELPSGFSANSANDFDLVTFGVQIQPIDQLVIKLDYQDWDDGNDRFSALIGWVF